MGLQRRTDETEIRGIGHQVFVQRRVVRQLAVGAEPQVPDRFDRLRIGRVLQGHRANLDGLGPAQLFRHALGHHGFQLVQQLPFAEQVLRPHHIGHRQLVLEAGFVRLERGAAGEDGLPFLDRADAAGGETAAVADPIDVVDHRLMGITGAQEITVHRVHMPLRCHRLARRRQRLPDHLAAEQLRKAQVLAVATEQVFLDPLQRQQAHQGIECLGHGNFLQAGPFSGKGGDFTV